MRNELQDDIFNSFIQTSFVKKKKKETKNTYMDFTR